MFPPTPPPGYFYQFSQYKIHQHSGDEIKFTFQTRVYGCDQKLFLSDFNECSCCTFNIYSGKPHRSSYLLKLYFSKSVVGILFLFPCIAVPTQKHGNEIPRSLCQNLISTSLHGNKIPTKCLGNEIPTNHSSELYTIYNPAPGRVYF